MRLNGVLCTETKAEYVQSKTKHPDRTNWITQVLIDWINSELEEERIIVKDLEEDCYDGQVLQKLFGRKWSHV